MKKRIFASLLSLCLIVGLLSMSVLAAENEAPDNEPPVICTMNESCGGQIHDKDCPLYTGTKDVPADDIEESLTDELEEAAQDYLTESEPNNTNNELIEKTVSTADELKNALTGTDTNVIITVINNIELPANITLSGNRNITLQGTTSDVKITFNQSVNDMTSDTARSMFYLQENANISMTVKNIVLDGGGTARLFYLDDSSGNNRNSLTLEAGAVLQNGHPQLSASETGNQPSGGAILLRNGTSFIMNGGKIINNIAERYGGAIYSWANDVIVELNDGQISRNSGLYAGGITMLGNTKLYLHGAQIINNNESQNMIYGGGIFFQDGSMYLGGSTIVRDNKVASGVNSDIYFNNDAKIYIDSALTGEIAFAATSRPRDIVAANDYTLTSNDALHLKMSTGDSIFYLDTAANAIKHTSSSKTITFHSNISNETYTQKVPVNIATSLIKNTFVRDGYIFNGWNTQKNGGGTAYKDQAKITTDKDITLYAQWIELKANDISMEYNAAQAVPNIEGVDLTWISDNEDIVIIEKDQIKAISVGTATITAQATTPNGGSATLTVDVEVTPMPITFGNGTGENPSGTVDHVYDGMAPDYFDYTAFYPATVEDGKVSIVPGSQEIALEAGNDIVFVYDDGSGSGAQDHDSLPVNVTDSEGMNVTVKLLNPNYRFVTDTNTALSETVSVTVKIHADNMDKQDLYINGEKVDVITDAFVKTYNGQGQAPVSDLTTVRSEGIDTFTVHFHPLNSNTDFEETHLTGAASDLTAEAVLEKAPKEPGQYLMIVNGLKEGTGTERGRYAYASAVFSIEKATVTIRPNDKTIYVGDALPELGADDYTVTGLAPGDSLTALPTLAYDGTPDTTKEGSYAIKASGAAVDEEHYTLKYEDGVLTISLSSGNTDPDDPGNSGNTDDSGNTDNTNQTDKADSLTKSPHTGDMGNITVWTALFTLSIIAAAAAFLRKKIR